MENNNSPAYFLNSDSSGLKIDLSKTGSILVEIFLSLYLFPASILNVNSIFFFFFHRNIAR